MILLIYSYLKISSVLFRLMLSKAYFWYYKWDNLFDFIIILI